MHIVSILSGAACMGCVMLTSIPSDRERRGRDDAPFLAVVLLASWGVSNVAWLMNSMEKLALMDGAIAALALFLLRQSGGGWRKWFAGLALAQMGLHALYAWYGPSFYGTFAVFYDLSFVGEIIAVSWGGAGVGRAWNWLHRLLARISQRHVARSVSR